MTKLQLRQMVQQLLGNRTTAVGTTIDDDWYDDRVIDGYRQLLATRRQDGRLIRFEEQEDTKTRTLDTSLGSNFVPNQTDVLLTIDVYDRDNDVGLNLATEATRRRRDPDETGRPREWRPGAKAGVRGYWIYPYPGTSDDDINVYETVILDPSLPLDTSEPVVEFVWHKAIAYAAAVEGAILIDWSEKAADMMNLFNATVATTATLKDTYDINAGLGGASLNVKVG